MDFWVSIGSTYSALTVLRIDAAARKADVPVRWRPFNVRTIMVEQNNIPFMNKPEKTAYMWRDIERRAAVHGLDLRLPAPYPVPELPFANAVAVLGMSEGWGPAYIRATYERWFRHGERPGEEPNLSASLTAAGADPEAAIARAQSSEIAEALAAETETARSLGVFGSPSFVSDGELFWGDDRLEAALDWETGRTRL
ncbi:2-hydroxychromene-2-carboxylate isomerase [Roseicyclus sediminis]|uniref:2-hydroxychromene-2-carboxylate isomerase n=1 Tax=Roseicyclus sediminis TaxID=2980997 RepID=UPI00292A55E1|nr:2-hydroxychromene-2-carboxylate isomerase [Roseibacterium sp. SDUM158016]